MLWDGDLGMIGMATWFFFALGGMDGDRRGSLWVYLPDTFRKLSGC